METQTQAHVRSTRLLVKTSRRDKAVESLADAVRKGLSSFPKSLPPRYFYDERGSELFERICELPEYYPTRTERSILLQYADEIAEHLPNQLTLVELGSGAAVKTRLLIDALLRRMRRLHYLPIDISRSALVESAKALLKDFPRLRITGYVSEYQTALDSIRKMDHGAKLIVFLGSNIGNFERSDADRFLKKVWSTMSTQDRLLMGVDLIKKRDLLIPAYDDAQGVTAAFNLNLLERINRALRANFDLNAFRHQVLLNKKQGRIEMHLESIQDQTVTIDSLNRRFSFRKGETIHTENSYKYSKQGIENLAHRNGFRLKHSWFDNQKWFSLNLLQPVND